MQRARAGGADRAPERSGAASQWDSQARRRVGSYGRPALRAGCGVTGCTVLRWEMGAAAGHGPGGRLGGSACDLRRCKSVTPRMSGQARASRCSCSSRREIREERIEVLERDTDAFADADGTPPSDGMGRPSVHANPHIIDRTARQERTSPCM